MHACRWLLSTLKNGYFIVPDFTFSVAMDTGAVSLSKSLDRETVSAITLVVVATDQGEGNNQDMVRYCQSTY